MMQVDFAALLEAMPDAVIVADLRSRVVYANRSVERLLGWSSDDLVGRSLHVIQPERLHGAHDAGFGRYATTGTTTLFDTPIRLPARRADGEEVDIELNLAEIHDRSGDRLVIGVLRDLSERVELERHLTVMRYLRATTSAAAQLWTALEPELVLQTLTDVLVDDFDAALARTWVHEAEGNQLRLVTSGGLSTRVAGSSREVLDVATYPYKVGVVARTRRPFVRNGLAGDSDFDQEWVARERMESVACLPLTTGGHLHGVMVAFFRHTIADEMVETLGHLSALAAAALNDADLIEQERLARAQADRARAEFELLARVSERIPGSLSPESTAQTVASVMVPDLADWCIFDLLEDGDLRMVAATHHDATRVEDIHELRERYPPDAEASPPHPIVRALRERATVRETVVDDDLQARAVDAAHLALLRRVGIGAHVVCPLVARGRVLGTLSLVRDPARPAFDDGETATAEDVARRAALAIDNALLYQSAQQAVSLRDRFLAVASHELRTPLAIVRGNWELLSRRLARRDPAAVDAAGDVTPLLRRLGQGIDQLQRLVEDLLDVNRLRGDAIGFQMTSVDLVELLRDTVTGMVDDRQRARITMDLPSQPIIGRWDAARVAQVVGNLVGNALKYSADAPVSVELTETADAAHLVVRDRGIGIAGEQLEAIFEPFQRAPNASERHYPGLGLGLAVSREIVMQLGGRLWATSPGEGQGSEFHVELPKQPVEPLPPGPIT